MIDADTVNPGIDLGLIDQPPSSDVGIRLGNHPCLRGETALVLARRFILVSLNTRFKLVHGNSLPHPFANPDQNVRHAWKDPGRAGTRA